MSWHIPAFLRILTSEVLFQIILKKVVHLPSREKMFLLQYIFCAIMSAGFALALGQVTFDWKMATVMTIGFFNGFAAYCQWRAVDIHQSKNAILTIFDDLIAMMLAYIFLNEGQHLNWIIGLGITLSLLSVVSFGINDYWKHGLKNNTALYFYVTVYSVIWGVALFAQKWFSYQEQMGVGAFLSSWYLGALGTAIIVVGLTWRKQPESITAQLKSCFSRHTLLVAASLAVCVLGSVALGYWTLALTPQNVAQPIWLVAQLVIPALIGLYIFKEAQDLDARDTFFILIGLAGGLIIAISY